MYVPFVEAFSRVKSAKEIVMVSSPLETDILTDQNIYLMSSLKLDVVKGLDNQQENNYFVNSLQINWICLGETDFMTCSLTIPTCKIR